MYPDLSYFLYDLLNIGPDNFFALAKTFGLFLLLALLSAAYVFRKELIRKENLGYLHGIEESRIPNGAITKESILFSTIFGLIAGAKIPYIIQHFDTIRLNPASAVFSADGNWVIGLLGAIAFGGYEYYKYKNQDPKFLQPITVKIMPHERIMTLTLLAGGMGLLGSKLFSVLENWGAFVKDPIGTFFSGSGLTIYGGLILAFTYIFFWVKKRGMRPIYVMDAVAPALILGYAVGRMGCQFSGDGDWGIVNNNPQPDWWFLPDWVWQWDYPRNVLREGVKMMDNCPFDYCYRLAEPVYPTPVYEIVMAGGIFLLLWSLRKRIKYTGVMFFLYVLLNGVERFFIEFIRVNPRYEIFGIELSQAQYIALALVVTGIVGIVYWMKKKEPALGQKIQ